MQRYIGTTAPQFTLEYIISNALKSVQGTSGKQQLEQHDATMPDQTCEHVVLQFIHPQNTHTKIGAPHQRVPYGRFDCGPIARILADEQTNSCAVQKQ